MKSASAISEFWMVIETRNGAQTPYNFRTQDKAEQYLQGLAGDSKVDGVQLMKMQSQSKPVTYHQPTLLNGIQPPPIKGKRVQPNLLRHSNEDWNAEILKIPGLEWAGHGSCDDVHRYELIGHFDALIALGSVEPQMLDVGISRKKFGPGYKTQALANNRFRLELRLERALDVAELKPEKASRSRRSIVDPISSSLKKTSILIRKYPTKFQADLYQGLCEAKGNGWQLIESFPWLAVRVFALNDRPAMEARHLVRQGARTREIAEYANVPMCFKRFMPKHTERLLKIYDLLLQHPEVVSHHCPKHAPDQGSWLSYIRKAHSSGSSEFAIWVAVHWDVFGKKSERREMLSKICDLRDWVRACVVQQIRSENIDSICQLINDEDVVSAIEQWWAGYYDLAEAGKPFNKEMSPQTAIKLSDEWHERQAEKQAADVEFPEPWYEGGDVGDYHIEPIRTAAELSKYAYHFHNCATSYAHHIANKECFFYVVSEGDDLKAMLEISRNGRGASVDQLKGPRNSEVSEELRTAIKTWTTSCKRPEKPAHDGSDKQPHSVA